MNITSFTPNLITNDMAATLAFYTEVLDFKMGMHVPEEAPFGWVQLMHGPVELMFQTSASIEEDLGIGQNGKTGGTLLFHCDVDDIEGLMKRVSEKAKLAFPMRETFYGMKEFGTYDPNGYLLVFAQRI